MIAGWVAVKRNWVVSNPLGIRALIEIKLGYRGWDSNPYGLSSYGF